MSGIKVTYIMEGEFLDKGLDVSSMDDQEIERRIKAYEAIEFGIKANGINGKLPHSTKEQEGLILKYRETQASKRDTDYEMRIKASLARESEEEYRKEFAREAARHDIKELRESDKSGQKFTKNEKAIVRGLMDALADCKPEELINKDGSVKVGYVNDTKAAGITGYLTAYIGVHPDSVKKFLNTMVDKKNNVKK